MSTIVYRFTFMYVTHIFFRLLKRSSHQEKKKEIFTERWMVFLWHHCGSPILDPIFLRMYYMILMRIFTIALSVCLWH